MFRARTVIAAANPHLGRGETLFKVGVEDATSTGADIRLKNVPFALTDTVDIFVTVVQVAEPSLFCTPLPVV